MADDTSFLDELASEASVSSSIPNEANLSRVRAKARELYDTSARVAELEAELKAAKTRRWELQMRELPDIMAEVGVDKIGLPGVDVDIVSRPYVRANISAEWDTERQESGFAEIERVGGGDIIRLTLSFNFGRGMYDELQEFLDKIKGLNLSFSPPEAEIAKTVPWNTLTAFVREQVERGTVLDLDKLGATVGTIVVIKKRS